VPSGAGLNAAWELAGDRVAAERKGAIMGMGDESDPGKDVSGRWIGGLIALALVIWLVYMTVTGGFGGQ
jgi:hypothetical protein